MYSPEQMAFLQTKAHYIWWMPPDEALNHTHILIAQIMDTGLSKDVGLLERLFSKEELAGVLKKARPGQFSPISWNFWHLRLNIISPLDPMPSLPRRRIGPEEFVPQEIADKWNRSPIDGK